jgi:hypothetical protein
MSARKINGVGVFRPVSVQSRQTRLFLAQDQVTVRRNGVEFRSITPIAPWIEMTVTLQSNRDSGKVHCTGVVVACNGNRHGGYLISMVFTNLSKHAQATLNHLAFA